MTHETTVEAVAKAITAFYDAHDGEATIDEIAAVALAAIPEAPCDGGCSYESGPDETCSAHGRPVAEVWEIVNDIARQRDEALAAIPEPATVGGVTREQILAALLVPTHAPMNTHDKRDGSCLECPWTTYDAGHEAIADAILALMDSAVATTPRNGQPTSHSAPSTVGTVDELAAEIARVAYVAQYQDKEWAERAWADMGGSEPSEERALLEVAIDEVIRPHFTPATTRDVGAEEAWDECVAIIEAKFFAGPTKDMVLGWLTNPYRAASAKGDGK